MRILRLMSLSRPRLSTSQLLWSQKAALHRDAVLKGTDCKIEAMMYAIDPMNPLKRPLLIFVPLPCLPRNGEIKILMPADAARCFACLHHHPAMEENPWQFVHVDPLAPKKRRKRRKLDPIEAQRSGQEAYRPREDTRFRKEPIGRVKIPGHTTAQAFKCVATSSSGDSPLARHVEQEEEAEESWATPLRQGVLQPSAIECGQLDDFDRYCLYSNGTRYDTSTASTIWCSLGVNIFFMWTPLAGSIIENSLFHYCA
jgi:hypothetical protein